VLFSPAFAKLQPRGTRHALPGLTSVFYHLAGNSFRCHRSENSPVSPAIATLPKTVAHKSFPCHTSEPPGWSFSGFHHYQRFCHYPFVSSAHGGCAGPVGAFSVISVLDPSFFLLGPSTFNCRLSTSSRLSAYLFAVTGRGTRNTGRGSSSHRSSHLPLPTGVLESEWKRHDT
jgi:hypothetical protein